MYVIIRYNCAIHRYNSAYTTMLQSDYTLDYGRIYDLRYAILGKIIGKTQITPINSVWS